MQPSNPPTYQNSQLFHLLRPSTLPYYLSLQRSDLNVAFISVVTRRPPHRTRSPNSSPHSLAAFLTAFTRRLPHHIHSPPSSPHSLVALLITFTRRLPHHVALIHRPPHPPCCLWHRLRRCLISPPSSPSLPAVPSLLFIAAVCRRIPHRIVVALYRCIRQYRSLYYRSLSPPYHCPRAASSELSTRSLSAALS